MEKTSFLLLASASLLLTGAHLRAQVLYDNGAAATGASGQGFDADVHAFDETEVGDVFTPTKAGVATVINFGGLYYGGDGGDLGTFGDAAPGTPPTSESFVISLYNTSGGAPTTLITSSTVSNINMVDLGLGISREIYEFSGTLDTPFTLALNTPYFLSISATTNPNDDFAVAVTTSPGSTNGYGKAQGSTTFKPNPDGGIPLSFSLAVPEPGEWGLALFGILALGVKRIQTRRTVQRGS